MFEAQSEKNRLDVLLVEDSPVQVMILKHVIRDVPVFNLLHVAEDGEPAMAFLRREGEFAEAGRPDVILCDINMPRKDGFEVLAEVKSDERLRSIPFVMLTTSDANDDIVRAYKEGANSFISKPIDLYGLESILNHFAHYWEAAKYATDVKTGKVDPQVALILPTVPVLIDAVLKPKSVEVLLVEDSPTQAMMIREIISDVREFNWLATMADGEQAMNFLRREGEFARAARPNLIVLDLNLPKQDGIEVLKQIKSDPGLRDIVVVVLTIRDQLEDIVKCYNEGANTYLTKPVSAEGMRAILHRFAGYWADEATKLPPARH